MQINSMGFLNSQLDMAVTAKIIAEYCANIQPGDNVIVISDDAQSRNVYTAITAAAAAAGAEASLLLYPTPKTDIPGDRIEAPRVIESVANGADIIILCGMKIPTHDYRIFSEVKVVMMTGMTEESIIRTIPVDYVAINKETSRLISLFNETRQIHVTCSQGTDVTFDTIGAQSQGANGTFRKLAYPMGSARESMHFLPAGRIGTFVGPDKVEGVIKIKSFLGLGITHGLVSLTVEKSRVTEVKGEGAEQWYVETLRRLLFMDENSNFVCEIGVGTNPAARLTGCYEDYGVQGSVRYGFGGSRHFGVDSRLHSDGFILGATMECDGKIVIKEGEYV